MAVNLNLDAKHLTAEWSRRQEMQMQKLGGGLGMGDSYEVYSPHLFCCLWAMEAVEIMLSSLMSSVHPG